jgi:extracellular elastinolytic metalloproteinase
MDSRRPGLRRPVPVAALVATTLSLGLGVAALPSAQGTQHDRAPFGAHVARTPAPHAEPDSGKGFYDSRQANPTASNAILAGSAARASSRPRTEQLRRSLGRQAVVDMDGLTGTPRLVARLDGFLTGPSARSAGQVALGYVRAHLAALGLTRADLLTLSLRRDYVDLTGTHHLSWTQSVDGIPAFSNGLRAAVTDSGRLLMLGGSPVSGLTAPPAQKWSKVTSRASAIARARISVGEAGAAGPQDSAERVLFSTRSRTLPAWRTITMSAPRPTLSVVDATDGRILYRQDLTVDADPVPLIRRGHVAAQRPVPSTGLAFRYFPRHKPGGRALHVNFTARGWLPHSAVVLRGNNSHAYADVNDDDAVSRNEEIPAKTPHSWAYRLKPFHLSHVSFCGNPYPCSWNPGKPFSWRVNRNQDATQVFFFVNNWHDHLQAAPIGFTEAAGNFQRVNATGKGRGGDAVQTQTDDGANTDRGLPDGDHIDNANMATPPDGKPPRMQMYLQHAPHTAYPGGDPFSPTNVGDEADTVYHEYTHGLSDRLVVDATGRTTLGPVQAGAMGEAWSDWYAMDYLVKRHLENDRPRSGDVVLFQYDGAGVALDRTEPLDCAVGAKARRCSGGRTGHRGGYTYVDYGSVVGFPEVHSDGEIWAQTLWDLRRRLGSGRAEMLVTRAMELSPADPSFLDERNAILLADLSAYGGRHRHAIWQVFARRGMGYFAGSFGGDDSSPGASFAMPPKGNAPGDITGTVTDHKTGQPVKGAVVSLAFEGSPFVTNPSTRTGVKGHYSLGPVPVGRYPKLTVFKRGYELATGAVRVRRGSTVHDVSLRRD